MTSPSDDAPIMLGQSVFDPSRRTLTAGESTSKLTPRTSKILEVLVAHGGHVVSHDVLMSSAPEGTVLTANGIHKIIVELRQAFAGIGESFGAVETVPRRGYRLTLPVIDPKELNAGPDPMPAEVGVNAAVESAAPSRDSAAPPEHLTSESGSSSPLNRPSYFARRRAFFAVLALVAMIGMVGMFAIMRQEVPVSDATDTDQPTNDSRVSVRLKLDDHLAADDLQRRQIGLIGDALRSALANWSGIHMIGQDAEPTAKDGEGDLLIEVLLSSGAEPKSGVVVTRTRDRVLLYSESYAHDASASEEIPYRAARDLLDVLDVIVDDGALENVWKEGSRRLPAWKAFQDGLRLRQVGGPRALAAAAAQFETAILRDPDFEAPYIELFATLHEQIRLETDPVQRKTLRSRMATDWDSMYLPKLRRRPELTYTQASQIRAGHPSLRLLEEALHVATRAETHSDHVGRFMSTYAALLVSARHYDEAAVLIKGLEAFEPPRYPAPLYRAEVEATIAAPAHRVWLLGNHLRQHPESLPTLLDLIIALVQQGAVDEARGYLERLQAADPRGDWYRLAAVVITARQSTDAAGETGPVDLDKEKLMPFAAGVAHFLGGRIAEGAQAWSRINADGSMEMLLRVPAIEALFPEEVVNSAGYQQALNDAGVGESWRTFLSARVVEVNAALDEALLERREQKYVPDAGEGE